MTISIIGTGVGLPAREVSNDELTAITGLDTSDQWISTMTGISSRRICVDETATDLATTAARAALLDAGVQGEDLDYILCATIGGDTRTPSLACAVADQISATCAALDVNGACAGFVYGLDLAASLISAGRARTILLVCTEKMSAHVDWTDRNTCVLFGDGAAACVITAGSMLKQIHVGAIPDMTAITMRNRMSGNSPLAPTRDEPGYVEMDGKRVFKYAVSIMEHEVQRCLDALDLAPDDIDHYVIHQANKRIIDFTISRLGLSPDKFPLNIDRYGNISAVSIPLLLHEMRGQGKIHPGDKLLLCAFGAGMTYGSCVMEWE
ncbi:MAG: beta-ketoacyl-ACP synthase 3 [Propionibacteriaceae bacterium]|nr:beta-ketoacyl-ACP synthase 3 [Propionibacteriaceae bacterium]